MAHGDQRFAMEALRDPFIVTIVSPPRYDVSHDRPKVQTLIINGEHGVYSSDVVASPDYLLQHLISHQPPDFVSLTLPYINATIASTWDHNAVPNVEGLGNWCRHGAPWSPGVAHDG